MSATRRRLGIARSPAAPGPTRSFFSRRPRQGTHFAFHASNDRGQRRPVCIDQKKAEGVTEYRSNIGRADPVQDDVPEAPRRKLMRFPRGRIRCEADYRDAIMESPGLVDLELDQEPEEMFLDDPLGSRDRRAGPRWPQFAHRINVVRLPQRALIGVLDWTYSKSQANPPALAPSVGRLSAGNSCARRQRAPEHTKHTRTRPSASRGGKVSETSDLARGLRPRSSGHHVSSREVTPLTSIESLLVRRLLRLIGRIGRGEPVG